MFPAVPLPDDSQVRTPVDAKLKAGWHYDAGRRVFVCESGDTFKPGVQLPKRSKILYKIPGLAKADRRKLSEPERDLQRYLQIVLPPSESAADYVDTVRAWPCIAEAELGPHVSLP